MNSCKKMLQYAQDAQVTDTPWLWWQWRRLEGEWHDCATPPSWSAHAKYRRKPEIDGKFKIGDCVTFVPKFKVGDRVTFADLPAVRARRASLIGQVFTVRGFTTAKETELRVLLADEICNLGDKGVRQSLLTLAPKFKVGDRVVFTSVDLIDPQHIGVSFEVVSEKGVWMSVRNPVTGFIYRTQVEKLTLAPQRLEALSKAVGFDVPMPLQEAPERGTRVFIAFTPQSSSLLWHGARSDVDELKANRLHLTAKNAEIHAKALAAISSPLFCQRLPK